MISGQCPYCKHILSGKGFLACEAFPEGIPQEIADGSVSHREPYEGDNGIQFEPIEE